ncbi:MAG: hypothetical protein IAA31_06085, partial [Candidatus Anaerobiospirillum merdipullorum]|nr:hypothetical protein [Candidatus Anaerobiospirillum merdipullorum]
YTISSEIFPQYLQSEHIIALTLKADELMQIGYILPHKQELSPLGQLYIAALRRYGQVNP